MQVICEVTNVVHIRVGSVRQIQRRKEGRVVKWGKLSGIITHAHIMLTKVVAALRESIIYHCFRRIRSANWPEMPNL